MTDPTDPSEQTPDEQTPDEQTWPDKTGRRTPLVNELYRSLMDRLAGLDTQLEELRDRDPATRSTVQTALDQLSDYPKYMRDLADHDLLRPGRPGPLAGKMRQYGENVVRASSKLLEWFASPHSVDLPAALFQEIEDSLIALQIDDRLAIVTTGLPNRIETYVADVRSVLYHPHPPPAQAAGPTLALITVPRQEGASPRWWPIILGHELAHLRISSILTHEESQTDQPPPDDTALPAELRTDVTSYPMLRRLDALRSFPFEAMRGAISEETTARKKHSAQPTPGVTAGESVGDGAAETPTSAAPDAKLDASTLASRVKIADAWATELVCDLAMARRYGPSAVAALGTYLTAVGDYSALSTTHPPGYLRLQLLLEHFGADADNVLSPVLEPWIDDVQAIEDAQPEWAVIIREHLRRHYTAVESELNTWPIDRYVWQEPMRVRAVTLAHRQLSFGVPPHAGTTSDYLPGFAEAVESHAALASSGNDTLDPETVVEPTDADVIFAAWLTVMALAQATGEARRSGADEPPNIPVDRLILKSLEDRQLLRAYATAESSPDRGAGSGSGVSGSAGRFSVAQREADSLKAGWSEIPALSRAGALLGGDSIRARMREPDPWNRLEVIPNLPNNVQTASIDVRLGTRYIIFHRAATTSFNAVEGSKAREVQRMVERGWGSPFVLHPGELVLASVLEYIAVPAGLAAQVVTRSSYGRLGLITATAVQVHPMYHGCLTLELANLGTVPLELFPGERIAQLVLFDVSMTESSARPGLKDIFGATYSCPTGPQFPNVSVDDWITRVYKKRNGKS